MNSICFLCKQESSSGLNGIVGYWYCAHCRLSWAKKISEAEYDETYYKGKSSVAVNLFMFVSLFFYKIRRMYIAKGKSTVWIDVGAGDGGFLKTVRAKKRIGVEVSLAGRRLMQENGLETLSDEQFLKARGLNADTISFWHVLEHVQNPLSYLESAKRNLKKNGAIVVGVPNIDSFEFEFFKKYWFHLQPQFHLWHFSSYSIKRMLRQCGFKVKKSDYWSVEHHLTGVLQSFVNGCSGSVDVLHKLIKRQKASSKIRAQDIFWSFFWLTAGFPIVFFFWIIGSVFQKSGTIVLVAKKG